ncbi:ABC transporter substrate-binding protein [Castellaniella sp.]|uniref:ABC transporter substrate-binding protein n=1 Tax=Castellaniella sp. TaxID=1955812 RepID=UPI00355D0A47
MNKFGLSFCAASLAALCLAQSAQAAEQRPEFVVGVVNSVTGGASAIAAGAVSTFDLLEDRYAKDDTLPFKVRFINYDDGSDPAKSVNTVRKLIQEDGAHLVICCTTTPASLAVNPVVDEARTPNLSLASAASVIDPAAEHPFTFKAPLTDRLMIAYTIDYMLDKGYKNVAFMGLDDSYGEGGWVEFKNIAADKGLNIVADERFARGDTNFTPQALKVSREKPDAVYFHAIPPSSALATAALRRVGYQGPIFHGAGTPTPSFIAVGKKAVEGAIVGATPFTVREQLPADYPLRPVIEAFVTSYDAKYGPGKVDMFSAQANDTMLVAIEALKLATQAGVDANDLPAARVAVRDALENVKDLKGVNGIYTFSPDNHLGIDERSTLLVEVEDGQFKLLAD